MTTDISIEKGMTWIPEKGTKCHVLRAGWSVIRTIFGEGDVRPVLSRKTISGPFRTRKEAEQCLLPE
jgi:hypothetical protein